MNVYCPNCEAACSDKAWRCPKCGHPLRNLGGALLRGGLIAAWLMFTFGMLGFSINRIIQDQQYLDDWTRRLQDRATAEQRDVIRGENRVIALAYQRREGPPGTEEAAGMRETYRDIRRLDRLPPELLPRLEQNIAALHGLVSKQAIEKLTWAGVHVNSGDTRRVRREIAAGYSD